VFGVLVAGLAVYLLRVGLDKADKVASSISVLVALVALGAPYLLPPPGGGAVRTEPDRVEDSNAATATAGGQANTGVDAVDDGAGRPAHVTRSGDARAEGTGSVANTGVRRRPRS
jgi:hypothetical protein